MNISTIWENPGLTNLAVVGTIFVLLFMQKIAAARRSRAQVSNINSERYGDDEERLSNQISRRSARRNKPARGGWFIASVCVGAAGMALFLRPAGIDKLMSQFTQFASPYISAITNVPLVSTPSGTSVNSDPLSDDTLNAPPLTGDISEIDAMVDAFVTDLRVQLPVTVSPGIIMAIVEGEKDLIALGFVISRLVAEKDEPKLQSDLETRFRESVCATKPSPTNLHGLNDLGVTLLINYADLSGKNVAELTVEPRFCSDNAADDPNLSQRR